MSLAVGETHGLDITKYLFANPEGVEFGFALSQSWQSSTPAGSIGMLWNVPGSRVSPTANVIVPLRGTH
jgi:hypothetical protein